MTDEQVPGEGAAGPFGAPFRVRFDEAGPDGLVRTSSLLRYAQDVAWLHSDSLGFDRAWYRDRALTWLVRAAELTVDRPIRAGSTLLVRTEVVGFRRVWSRRHTEVVDGSNGHRVATVDIDWVLLDGHGAPTRIPPEIDSAFGRSVAASGAGLTLRRVSLGDAGPEVQARQFGVRPQELDPLDHVNNAVYADWLDEAVIAAGGRDDVRALPRTVGLEYALAAGPDEQVTTQTWRDGQAWACRVNGANGEEFLRARLGRPATATS